MENIEIAVNDDFDSGDKILVIKIPRALFLSISQEELRTTLSDLFKNWGNGNEVEGNQPHAPRVNS